MDQTFDFWFCASSFHHNWLHSKRMKGVAFGQHETWPQFLSHSILPQQINSILKYCDWQRCCAKCLNTHKHGVYKNNKFCPIWSEKNGAQKVHAEAKIARSESKTHHIYGVFGECTCWRIICKITFETMCALYVDMWRSKQTTKCIRWKHVENRKRGCERLCNEFTKKAHSHTYTLVHIAHIPMEHKGRVE